MVVVDPVMGDHGKLYPIINKNIVRKMKDLVDKSDIITPNYTEAIFLLDKEYDKNINEAEIKDILIELSNLGPKIVVITSIPDIDKPDSINVAAYSRENQEFWKTNCKLIPIDYPGTGDIFTSVLIGHILIWRQAIYSIKSNCRFDVYYYRKEFQL